MSRMLEDFPPMAPLAMEPAMLSWVGAATAALKGVGLRVDTTDVAGHSGYAFRIVMDSKLSMAAPTMFDWSTLLPGIWRLGRTTAVFYGGETYSESNHAPRVREHCREAFDMVARYTAMGVPCVIWGAYKPEFAVVYKCDDMCYYLDSFRRFTHVAQEPVRWDHLDAPGGIYALAIPSATKPLGDPDKEAIAHAVRVMGENTNYGPCTSGLNAYRVWAQTVHSGRAVDSMGAGYNAACWSEARHFAHQFLNRLAQRNKTGAQILLATAAAAFERSAKALSELTHRYPFPVDHGHAEPLNIQAVIKDLTEAHAADVEAFKAMREALPAWK